MMNEKETLDCMAIKREAQESIYEEIKGLSHQEEIVYFRNAVASSWLKEWWEKSRVSSYRPTEDKELVTV